MILFKLLFHRIFQFGKLTNRSILIRKRAKTKKSTDEDELMIETALDYEDKCLKELNSFKFAPRLLSADFPASSPSDAPASLQRLKNTDHILDKKLILLIRDEATSSWTLPQLEWDPVNHPCLRTVISQHLNIHICFIFVFLIDIHSTQMGVATDGGYSCQQAQRTLTSELSWQRTDWRVQDQGRRDD